MTLGYCMQFCSTCERETNHRIREHNSIMTKECSVCCHTTGPGASASPRKFKVPAYHLSSAEGVTWGRPVLSRL